MTWSQHGTARYVFGECSEEQIATDPKYVRSGMACGMALGSALDVILDSLVVGLAIGMGTGVTVGIGTGTCANSD